MRCLFACLVLLMPVVAVHAAAHNVPAQYATIQDAIDHANAGDEVVIAPGRYKECIDFKGKAITVRSTNPDDPAVVAATIIDGRQKGSVVTFKSGETAAAVITGFTITNGSGAFDQNGNLGGGGVSCWYGSGPTITKNVIAGNSAGDWGGGIYCRSASPTIAENRIIGNRSTTGGAFGCHGPGSPVITGNTVSNNSADTSGGLWCRDSSALVTNNIITGNTAVFGGSGRGGGVTCDKSGNVPNSGEATVSGNLITHNTADAGGGVYCAMGTAPTISNNTIRHNQGTYGGGGVLCDFDSRPALAGNSISDNAADAGPGGGVLGWCAKGTLTDNTISGNYAAQTGGGVHWDAYAQSEALVPSVLTNNAIVGNRAAGDGGGLYLVDDCRMTMINNTIAANVATRGGGLFSQGSVLTLTNTVVALNLQGGGLSTCDDPQARTAFTITYCDFYGNTGSNFINLPDPTGTNGNLSANPCFAAPARSDYRLKSTAGRWDGITWVKDTVTSPCLDTGAPATAFADEPTPNGGRVNMGFDGNTTQASLSAPWVYSWGPKSASAGPQPTVVVAFTTRMRQASVQTCFVLAPDTPGAAAVAGSFGWTACKLTFTPSAPLAPATTYRVTIKPAAKSTGGIAMGRPFTWTFTTRAASSSALLVTATAAGTAQGAQVTVNLTSAANVQTTVLNLAGRTVATLPEQTCAAGTTTLLWNGRSVTGTLVPGGTYLLRVTARGADGGQSSTLAGFSLRR